MPFLHATQPCVDAWKEMMGPNFSLFVKFSGLGPKSEKAGQKRAPKNRYALSASVPRVCCASFSEGLSNMKVPILIPSFLYLLILPPLSLFNWIFVVVADHFQPGHGVVQKYRNR
jgi:hypothetical protein